MVGLYQFRDIAREHEVCEKYGERWDNCVTKKDFFDLACEVQGAQFLVKAISEGWGISPSAITEDFPRMINGGYVAEIATSDGKTYDSQVVCQYAGGSYKCATTVCVVIDTRATIEIAENCVCMLFVDATSDIRIVCPASSKVRVESYSRNISTDNANNTKIKFGTNI